MKRFRAITMIEILLSITVISLALIPFFTVMIWGRDKAEITLDQVVAQTRALNYLEYMHSLPYDTLKPPVQLPLGLLPPLEGFEVEPLVPEDSFECTFQPLNAEETVTVKYKVITVKVRWTHLDKPKEIELADIFVDSL